MNKHICPALPRKRLLNRTTACHLLYLIYAKRCPVLLGTLVKLGKKRSYPILNLTFNLSKCILINITYWGLGQGTGIARDRDRFCGI